MLMRTLLQFLGGGGAFVFGAFGVFLGFGMFFIPDDQPNAWWAHRSAIFMTIFVGGVPLTIGTLLMWNASRQRGLYKRLGELAAVARMTNGDIATSQVAQTLVLTPLEAEKLVVQASTLGIIEEGPPPGPPPWGSTPPPPMTPPAHASAPPPAHAAALPMAATVQANGASTPSGRPPPPLGTGSILADTYRIEEPLGQGGMGQVFAARHLRTGRRYAVKTILQNERTSGMALRRFEREATAASALRHPNIVQVHDFNVGADGTFFLVMDLLEGETLAQRIGRVGPLPWPEAQRITTELCSALAAAHGQGLLHRDIKPSNVFLARTQSAPDRSVLVDFGLVKSLDDSAPGMTSTGAVIGTPMYMSPEQARGETLDPRADLYSLACVVFEAVTGAPPFLDRTMAAIYMKILNTPPPRASASAPRPLPRALDDVLAKALAKARDARYADVREFGAAIAAIGEETAAPGTEPLARPLAPDR